MRKLFMAVALIAVLFSSGEAKAWGCYVPPLPQASPAVNSATGWPVAGILFPFLQAGIFFAPEIIQSELIKDGAEAVGLQTNSCNSCGDFPQPVHEFGV